MKFKYLILSSLIFSMPAQASSRDCLAKVMSYEARGEGKRGQKAVGQVVMNRVSSPKFPNSVCGVVHQRGQFSSVRNHRGRADSSLVSQVLSGATEGIVKGALYFTTRWFSKLTHVLNIGSHKFFK